MLLAAACALSGGFPGDAQAGYRADYDRALRLGKLGYEYGYPVLRSYEVRREALTVGPENELQNSRQLAGPEARSAPRPNVDTLYSTAYLNLSDEPIILTVPDVGKDRYYSFQFLDPYTNVVDYVGTRTTGDGAGHYAITPESWSGALPDGVQRIDAPYDHLWLMGRTGTDGDGTLEDEHAIQDGYRLTPLAAFEEAGPAGPPPPPTGTPRDYAIPSGLRYFDSLGILLKLAPPPAADDPLLDRLAAVGVAPGKRPSSNGRLSRGIKAGLRDAVGWRRSCGGSGVERNGWRAPPPRIGRYGTDYCLRASVARSGLGANTLEELIYLGAAEDSSGAVLSGERDYVVHFDNPPPADAFWSLTAYGPGGFLEANSIGRYALGDRSGLQYNADGSVDLYLSDDGDVPEERNWLPVPAGGFSLTMRLYEPGPAALDGSWSPPPVSRR